MEHTSLQIINNWLVDNILDLIGFDKSFPA